MSELNIPDHWAVTKFAEISVRKGGGTPSRSQPKFFKGRIPWITVADLPKDIFDVFHIETSRESITEDAVLESSTNIIPEGSVILSTRVSVGKIGINRVPVCTNQDFSSFIDIKVYNKYLAYFLLSISKNLLGSAKGTTIKGINVTDLEKVELPIPPFAEQVRIVEKIEICFQKIKLIEANLNKVSTLSMKSTDHGGIVEKLKDSILFKAFTGTLVPRDTLEGTGHEFLKEIIKQKNQEASTKEIINKKVAKKLSKKKAHKK